MIDNYLLVSVLSDLCTKDDVISPGMSSTCCVHIAQAWRVKYGQRFNIFGAAAGSMGFGIAGAIGAYHATGKRVICINGDGGFQMNIQELQNVKDAPIKFFVLNNGGYLAIMNTQRAHFESRYVGSNAPDLTLPSLEKIAQVYNIDYYKLEDEGDVYPVCRQALSGARPCIVEVMESDRQQTVMRVATKLVNGVPTSGDFGDV